MIQPSDSDIGRHKQMAKWIATVSIPILISTGLSWYFQRSLPRWVPGIFGAIAAAVIVYHFVSEKLIQKIWWIQHQNRLRDAEIGILLEKGCPSSSTKFDPDDWSESLSRSTNHVGVDQEWDDYAVIVNPYGEVYPEQSIVNPRLKTFEKILSYVSTGGIFVSAGGYPFFYAWHTRTERKVPQAEDLMGYAGPIERDQAFLQPTVTGEVSLVDTLIGRRFDLKTTLEGTHTAECFQESQDQDYVGELTSVGGTKKIQEFRAIREPAGECIPLLRMSIYREFTVYPLVALPYGEGFLIMAGMALGSDEIHGDHNLSEVGFEKVVTGIENFIEHEKATKLE